MEIDPAIFDELRLLGSTFLLGVALMIFYDGIRLLRVLFSHGPIAIFLEDMFFWMVAAIATFVLLFLENCGRVRFYAMASEGLGMLLYYQIIGKRWPRLLRPKVKKCKESMKKALKQKESIEKNSVER